MREQVIMPTKKSETKPNEENSGRQLKEDLESIYGKPSKEEKENECSGSDSSSESCKES